MLIVMRSSLLWPPGPGSAGAVHACDEGKADELDSQLSNSDAVQLPPPPGGAGVGPGADSSHIVGVLRLPICPMVGSMANESTGTGVAELDRALDGLYWGDNVVWVWEGSEPHQQLFYDAIAQRRDDFGAAGYVAASSDPAEITARWPWLEILDARAGTPIASPRQLLEAIHKFCARAPRPLLLFDSLAPLAERGRMRIARGGGGHCCQRQRQRGASAYWSVPGAGHYQT